MSERFIQDIYLTNSIINFLFAGYQGAFASFNLLSQLESESFNQDELSWAEGHLIEIEKWKEDLMKGLPIFSSTWQSAQTVASRKAFEILGELRRDLIKISGHIKKALLAEDLSNSAEDVKYLVAAFVRQAYARENYVRGFVEFGQSFKHQNIVDSYSQFIPQVEHSIGIAHMFVDILRSGQGLFPVFFKGLYEESIFLPGVFQAQVHDANILLNTYSQPATYESLGIIPQHKDAWLSINIDPVAAGYWQAWGFAPEIAANWIEAGFTDPRAAWFWNALGFNAKEALDWLQAGFSPPSAREWREKGHPTPQSALEVIEDMELKDKVQKQVKREKTVENIPENSPKKEAQILDAEADDDWEAFKEKHKKNKTAE